nr:MAG TPA: hypothetical protein [Caudoviricetes sp.]
MKLITNNKYKKILSELSEEIQADIQMLDEYNERICTILESKTIILDELDEDIQNAIQRRLSKRYALLEDIVNLENTYNINVDYNNVKKCITGLNLKS